MKMPFGESETPDQPGHPGRLILSYTACIWHTINAAFGKVRVNTYIKHTVTCNNYVYYFHTLFLHCLLLIVEEMHSEYDEEFIINKAYKLLKKCIILIIKQWLHTKLYLF